MLSATVFFLYWNFPSEAVKTYLVTHANRVHPDLRITMDHIKPVFPPGIQIDIRLHHGDRTLFFAQKLKAVPQLKSFFGQKTIYNLSGITYGGKLKGTLSLSENKPAHQIYIDANLFGIQLEKIPIVQSLFEADISGTCDGRVIYRDRVGRRGRFNTKFSVSGCKLKSTTPFLGSEILVINQITAEVVIDNNRFQIKNCMLKGPQGSGRLSGIITLRYPPQASTLNLTGTLNPSSEFLAVLEKEYGNSRFSKKGSDRMDLFFRIDGALKSPNVVFN
ncbi:MAG: type II secretion system protein GspN [Deltaproteobacteria bacterium]|nr:type II secretion system protein GspN [Deltaproteobacteria bacterium]